MAGGGCQADFTRRISPESLLNKVTIYRIEWRTEEPMTTSTRTRAKISTTIARENFQYLEEFIRAGQAENTAQALDLILHRFRRAENRKRLESATAAYFNGLDEKCRDEEDALTEALAQATAGMDFERE
jgi:hypothetical protein